MSAGLLRRVVDTVQRYRAVLPADKCVETGGGRFAVDGDDVLARPRPRDIESVERGGEEADDVFGPIGEVVADAANSTVICDDAAAVAVDETENEFLGVKLCGAADRFVCALDGTIGSHARV